MRFVKQRKQQIILLLIIALGAFLRFYNLNWDQGFHLHPDERFITMVGNAMRIPNTVADYFNPQTSTFNPTNIGFGFFVYGIFPLTLNKILAVFLSNDSYNSFTLQGRFLSALFDVLIILLVYKTTELLERKYNLNSSVKYWASFFYAIAVLPIQLSHFFAVDTFLNFFMFASSYWGLSFLLTKRPFNIVLSAVFFGLAVSSKISAITILPLIFLMLLYGVFKKEKQTFLGIAFIKQLFRRESLSKQIVKTIVLLFLYVVVGYVTIRFTDPYLFESTNLLNPPINKIFLENIKALKSFEGQDIWYPPAIQWIHKQPVIFSLTNLAFLGVGLPYFILIFTGFYFVIRKFRYFDLLIILFWTIGFFLYQSTQFVKAMRYFIFIYPFLAVFAGIGFYYLVQKWRTLFRTITFTAVLIWPLLFMGIYTQKHSRVTSSEWIYENIENGSVILGEYWDDPLPLPVHNTFGKSFTIKQLPVFDLDTPEKWQKMSELLNTAGYLVLSSNKGWASIPTVPEKYPLMSKFYQDLFADRLQYRKIKEFTSYPKFSILNFQFSINDDWADEQFTVHDHPKVIIFKNALKYL